MNQRRRLGLSILAVVIVAASISPRQLVAEAGARADPIRRTLVFRGTERQYFVYLPADSIVTPNTGRSSWLEASAGAISFPMESRNVSQNLDSTR